MSISTSLREDVAAFLRLEGIPAIVRKDGDAVVVVIRDWKDRIAAQSVMRRKISADILPLISVRAPKRRYP